MADAAKVTVELDAEEVAKAREAMGVASDEPDAAVVQRALNAYLLGRLMDRVQSGSSLSEEEATKLAYDELHASRRERRSTA